MGKNKTAKSRKKPYSKPQDDPAVKSPTYREILLVK